MIIESKKSYNVKYKISLCYYVDDFGIIWYRYDDISELFGYSSGLAFDIYENHIDELNKRQYSEYIDTCTGKILNRKNYINTIALFELIKRNERINGAIKQSVIDLECSLGIIQPDDSNNHMLKVNLNLLKSELESDNEDYKLLSNISSSILESPTIQSILNDEAINKEIEEMIHDETISDDELKEYICQLIDNEEVSAITVESNNNKNVRYRKLKTKSTCPSWLSELV